MFRFERRSSRRRYWISQLERQRFRLPLRHRPELDLGVEVTSSSQLTAVEITSCGLRSDEVRTLRPKDLQFCHRPLGVGPATRLRLLIGLMLLLISLRGGGLARRGVVTDTVKLNPTEMRAPGLRMAIALLRTGKANVPEMGAAHRDDAACFRRRRVRSIR